MRPFKSFLRRAAKAALPILGISYHRSSDEPDFDLRSLRVPSEPAALISELGLLEDAIPVRDYPWWTPPARILVMGATAQRIRWLQDVAASVELLSAYTESEALALADGIDGMIGWYMPGVVSKARRMRWLQVSAAGIENIPASGLVQRESIIVTNMQKAASPAIAEHAMALMFAVARGLVVHAENQVHRRWKAQASWLSPMSGLRGRRILIAGLGGIGLRVAQMASGLGMQVDAIRARSLPFPPMISRCGTLEDLPTLVADADVVVNSLPFTENTRRVFDAHVFRAMRQGALFINVGRGESVDTDALVHALRAGHLGGAGLDVVDPEPLPRRHPLWRMQNVVVTPHVASHSPLTRCCEWAIKKENLRRFVSGDPMLSVVDLKRGY